MTRHQHPRGVQAGFWGLVAAQAAWEVCKAHDKPGELPSHYWSAEYLARWCQLDRERGGMAGMKRGMERAVEAGLVELLPDGTARIHDWDQRNIDPRTSKRKRTRKKDGGLHGECPGPSRVIQDDPGRPGTDLDERALQDGTDPDPPPTPPAGGEGEVYRVALEWQIWSEYQARFSEKMGGTIPPTTQGTSTILADIKRQLNHLRKAETTDAQYLAAVCKALDAYFSMHDDKVTEQGFPLWLFRDRLPRIIQQLRRSR